MLIKEIKGAFTKVVFGDYRRRALTSKLYFTLKEFKLIEFLLILFLYYYSPYLHFLD